MKKLYNFTRKNTCVKALFYKTSLFLFVVLCLFGKTANAQIYNDNFGPTAAGFAYPYTPLTGYSTSDPNLSSFAWTNSISSWTSYNGQAGQAIALNNSGGTPTITLTFEVAPGFAANITGTSLWRNRSGTGAQNWSMTINGIAAGSESSINTANVTYTSGPLSINNLTGTVTVVISLSGATGTGTFRIDNFILNGTVTPAKTIAVTTPAGFPSQCINILSAANGFSVSGANLNAGNITITSSLPAVFTVSTDNVTFGSPKTLNVASAGTLAPTSLYVKFLPTAAITYNGTITISGAGVGANTVVVNISGTGVNTKPSITDGTVSNITTSSADIAATITATGCSAVTAWGIKWSTTPGFDPTTTGTVVAGGALSGGNFTASVAGLAPPGTTIYFYTFATNAGGVTYGNANSFVLLNTVPTLSVPSSGGGSLTGFGNVCINTGLVNSFKLSGSVLNGTNIVIGPLANYSFSLSAGGTYTATLTLVNGGGPYSYTGGVVSATIYVKFIPTAVASYNGNIPVTGGGAPAINVAATGSGVNTAPTVSAGAAVFITTTTATLPGSIVDPGCGTITSYGIEYSTISNFAFGGGTRIAGSNLAGGNFSVNLTGLLPNQTYYYYVYAINAGGTSNNPVSPSPLNFTTFSPPVKLVIIGSPAPTPGTPTAQAPYSIQVQAQNAAGVPEDVTVDTYIQLTGVTGTHTFTFPNGSATVGITPPGVSGIIPAGINTITITDNSYDIPENGVSIKASASAGMALTTSAACTPFNVIAYAGGTTFEWDDAGGGAWFVSSGAQNWRILPGFAIPAVPPGASSGVNNHIAIYSSHASLPLSPNPAQVAFNMSRAGGADYSMGGISFDQTYNTLAVGNVVQFGNSSTSASSPPLKSGVISLYGTNVINLGGIAGNNFTGLLIGNYMSNATTKTLQFINTTGEAVTLGVNLAAAGSIVAGPGNIININTVLTGTNALQVTGGGTLILTPAGTASVNNGFTSAITVNNGYLVAGNAGAFSTVTPNPITLGSTSATVFGVLRLNGNSVTIGGLNSTGAFGSAVVDNTGITNATLAISNAVNNSFNGTVKDNGGHSLALIKTGAGNLTFTGASSFSGGTTINAGKVILNHVGGGTFPLGSISVNGTGALQVSTDQTIKDLTLATGGTLIVDAGVTLTITGVYNATTCTVNNLGTIKLQGTALQTFPGTAAVVSAMNNLTINDNSGVNLNNSLNITGTLNINAGIFTVGPYTLTLNNPITGIVLNFSANNTSSIVIAGTAAGVNIPASVTQLKNLTVTNTVGSTLQGNLNVSTDVKITAGTLDDNIKVLNGTANLTMTAGMLSLEQPGAVLPGFTGLYALTGGNVLFNCPGIGTDAQTVRPVNYFDLSSLTGGDRILSPTGVIGVSNIFSPNVPNNHYTILNSTIDYNKTTAQNIAAFDYYNMTLSSPGVSTIIKTLSGNISVLGELKLTAKTTFNLNDLTTTLRSDATSTANVAQIVTANSINYGTLDNGKFVIERYIPAGVHGKSWQLLAAPIKGTQSVNASWQEGLAPRAVSVATNGYGTTISSEKAGSYPGRGYDFYTIPGPSMKTYNSGTGKWDGIDNGVTNTNAIPIFNKKGYMILVRGDRNIQSSVGSNNTTLRTAGKIYALGTDAPLTTAMGVGKTESVANPYPSAIDFTNLRTTSSNVIDAKYWVWDPTLPGTQNFGLGGYQLISSMNSWMPSPGSALYPAGTPYTKIQSGQAFFVYSTPGGGSVTFQESNKLSGSSLLNRVDAVSGRQFMRTYLQGEFGMIADGCIAVFDPLTQNVFDADDAIKLDVATENIGISNYGKTLALDARKPIAASDTIFYNLGNLGVHSYQLLFAPENMDPALLSGYLVDRFKGTKTTVSIFDTTRFNFDVTADPASKSPGRFYLIFKTSGTVPVTFVSLSATRNSDKNVDVSWKVENETGINFYDVERSADGLNFTGISATLPKLNNGGSTSYDFVDTRSFKGDNFYRIRSSGLDGNVRYSTVVKVVGIAVSAYINIYPNPVVDKTINVTFVNEPAGNYALQLSNKAGQIVYNSSVEINNNNTIKSFKLGSEVAAGIYQLSIRSANIKSVQQVVIK